MVRLIVLLEVTSRRASHPAEAQDETAGLWRQDAAVDASWQNDIAIPDMRDRMFADASTAGRET